MGGAVSRLNETDWQQADGGMRKSPVHGSTLPSIPHNYKPFFDSTTLDGRPPTLAYGTYNLPKHSVLAQQRYLDVTDSHANLLYEIRPTPHTLTAFDVYDGATQRHLLRITTDLARRYWIVCRVGIPAYEGQAEEPMVMDEGDSTLGGDDRRNQQCEEEEEKKQYFKVACVTVSWSRYMSVAAYYGPPTGEQVTNYNRQQEELMLEQQAIANRRSDSSSCEDLFSMIDNDNNDGGADGLRATSSDSAPKTTMSLDEEIPTSGVTRASEEKKTDICDLSSCPGTRVDLSLASTDGSSPRSEPDHCSLEQVDNSESDALQSSNSMPELQQFTSWFQKTSRGLQKQIVAQQDQIYSTGKDYLQKRSLKLKATALQDPQRGVIHLDKPLLLCQEIYNKFIGNHQTSRVSKQEVLQLLRQDMEQHLQQQESSGEQPATAAATMNDLSETLQKEEDEAEKNNPLVHAVVEDNDTPNKDAEQPQQQQQQPPLVGYWHWEHTLRTHKMKMHVAKGTDLALHVVMAVLVNQVRYERNAIAMTV